MNLNPCKRILFGLALVGLALLLNGTAPAARAAPGEAFVRPDGSGTLCSQAQPCALHTAIDQAVAGDTLYVAAGRYPGTGAAVVTLTKSLALYGGWDGTATTPPLCDPYTYVTTLDGEDQRRVIYIKGPISPTITGFVITHGQDYTGGGIYTEDAAPVIVGNVITDNVAFYYGGGIYVDSGTPVISANTILSNSVTYGGGGINFLQPAWAILHNNRIADNRASYGGGFEVDQGIVTATANVIVHNQGSNAVGVSTTGSRFVAANNIVANNTTRGFDIMSTRAHLVHNTIVGNGAFGVDASYTATITLTNNIIAHHSMGSIATWTGATISASHNLFWNNGADPITGTHAVLTDPRFVNPSAGDYHINPGSAAAGRGVDLGVTTDVDGDERPAPAGTRPDLGADEVSQRRVYLPLVTR